MAKAYITSCYDVLQMQKPLAAKTDETVKMHLSMIEGIQSKMK